MKDKNNPHIYDLTGRGSDGLLWLIRYVFQSWPEFRHNSFKRVAKGAPFIPFMRGTPDLSDNLKCEVTFADGSNPLHFGCPIILAAGANKTALDISSYANMGFGGITVGTATRKFRIGNTHKPRIGFLEKERAIYNSMGLNNEGVEVIANRVEKQLEKAHKVNLCVGISIAETPGLNDECQKLNDVIESFSIAYNVCDYIEINVSCPNTGENRVDQDTAFIKKIFENIKEYRDKQTFRKAVYAKLSPDLTKDHLKSIMKILEQFGVNGVVMGNTYPTKKMKNLHIPTGISYDDLEILRNDGDRGGLSGKPLYRNMVKQVRYIRLHYPKMSVIACGGIDNGRKIYKLLKLGVDAVQCYSVVAFRWMAAHAMRKELLDLLKMDGYNALADYDGFSCKK